jgi:hypothetical protein
VENQQVMLSIFPTLDDYRVNNPARSFAPLDRQNTNKRRVA